MQAVVAEGAEQVMELPDLVALVAEVQVQVIPPQMVVEHQAQPQPQ